MLNISTESLDSLLAAARQAAAAGQLPRAESLFRQILTQNPAHLPALNDLGVQLQSLNRFAEAIDIYQQTLRFHPTDPTALNNLGVVLQHVGHTDHAIVAYRTLLQHYPDNASVHSNLGTALQDCGLINDALKSLRRAIELDPNLIPAASALLIILQYHPDYDARAIYRESKHWNDTLVKRLVPQPFTTHPNDRSPLGGGRRLKIGYVSPDLSDHSVGRFMASILAHHDHKNFDIFCYHLSPVVDPVTTRLQQHTDTWRNVANLSDPDLANLIRNDKIDILIDLAMHTHGGRPLVFARKPAPIQITYLAYAGTTGLTTIDYRLSDPLLDPPGADESVYSEKTLRLSQSYWCYDLPQADAGGGLQSIGPLPAEKNNHITFGCLNTFAKINDAVLQTWSQLLAAVPNSRLLLFCPEGNHRQHVLNLLTQHGAPEKNIAFVTRGPFLQYLQTYHKIDIALDPFPYAGGTTTCDALYMGVPVITLAGNKPVARAGASILSNAGHPELVATSPEHYLQIATTLASNLPALAQLRRTLRPTMQSSPLMNAPALTQSLESLYRQAWHSWCQTEPVA